MGYGAPRDPAGFDSSGSLSANKKGPPCGGLFYWRTEIGERALVRPIWRQPNRGASAARYPRQSRGRGTCLEHVPSDPDLRAITPPNWTTASVSSTSNHPP